MNTDVRHSPFWFFGLFALLSLLLLPMWNELDGWYLTTLTAVVNNTSVWVGLPSQFHLGTVSGEEAIAPGIVAGTALFIATPNRSALWKAVWIVALLLTFSLLQYLLMTLQIHIAYADFFTQLPFSQQSHYPPATLSPRPDSLYATIVESGTYWTNSLLFLLLWIVATRQQKSS
ncbi:MAG: hypothetical protein VX733_08890 [Candidatus Latescibacterota bacterium]|nr:hypothetical protein [Candidatus Latescibacterota bacterium]